MTERRLRIQAAKIGLLHRVAGRTLELIQWDHTKLEEVTGPRGVRAFLLRPLPPRNSTPDKQRKMDGWMKYSKWDFHMKVYVICTALQ